MSKKSHTILLVEDDIELSKLVSDYLSENGFNVTAIHNGLDVDKALELHVFDLVILDIMLPGKDGISICRDIRNSFDGKIVMFTAKNEEIDQIIGLEMGADEYLPKPISPRLLLTKIKVLLRRSEPKNSISKDTFNEVLQTGDISIKTQSREVFLHEEPVSLTTAEYDLLLFLVQNKGIVLTRDEIYKAVRGIEYDGIDRSIDLRIARLRNKLGDTGKEPKLIKSVRGTGYLLVGS